jgi:hypothetical protein
LLLQNIDIPEITLIVHPEVAKIIKKAAESNVKPTVSRGLQSRLSFYKWVVWNQHLYETKAVGYC